MLKITDPKITSCTCEKCVDACMCQPGGLIPSDVKPIAAFLGITEQELFETYLVIDYWVGEAGNEEFLRPNKIITPPPNTPELLRDNYQSEPAGRIVSWGWALKLGRCVFLDEADRCRIHPVRPWNCRNALACDPEHDRLPKDKLVNKALAEAWEGVDIRKLFLSAVSKGKSSG